ncbi:MAG: hypothetical protein MUC64_06335 [Rubritepida sp.]|jgi:hypothetical protein|nr:hypothetical protein [Rubritepida sp.]
MTRLPTLLALAALALPVPAGAQLPADTATSLPVPAGGSWWVRPDLPWADQPLVVVLAEPGGEVAAERQALALLRLGIASLLLPAPADIGEAWRLAAKGADAGREAGFAPGRLGFLASGTVAAAALKVAAGAPVVLVEPACEALEVPRPGPALVLAGAAATAACPPPPAWPALEAAPLPGGAGASEVAERAATRAAAWLCRAFAPCVQPAP